MADRAATPGRHLHDDRKRAAMHPTDPKPLVDYFQEGLEARQDGKALHDNPYAAGSADRREWHAGFCATLDVEDQDGLDPEDGRTRAI